MAVTGIDGRLYKDQASADKAAARLANAPDLSGTSKTTSTPTTQTTSTSTTTSTNIAKPEYQGSGNQTQVTTPYQNQGEGQYSYNEKSGYYEKQGTSGASTPTTPTTPTSTSTSGFSAAETAKIRNAWDNLTYEQQQQKLKENPNLRANLSKYGAVEKAAPVSETPKEETPKTEGTEGGWDYQDNSPERMSEIADNVNKFAISDPDLFTNEEAFRNFFIDGKGRTPEQEKFLMDFYKNRKMYNKLDTYTSDQVGSMYVNGEIPESYLTYLKNTDPERYAYVMDAKAAATDRIKDSASLDTINSLQGGEDTSTSKVIQWLKDNGLLVDKDGNLVDDRRENYASDEENKYLKEIADLNARNLDIDNTVKHTFDDLVEKYPGATKATLMAMAQDINSDLLREKENNLVELTKFQGYVNYMQSERQEMNAAGVDTISQLQKQYGMYYDYTPQGMAEMAQMQYAATNVTLDQADSGTYTQKQMALESVLSPIYQQYGSIIERPMAKAINDIIAYAQNKGVSLSQAFEDNFMKYLKEKPQYSQLSSTEPYTIKVGDVAYQYNFETGEFTPINTSVIGTATGLGTMRTERNNNPTAMITAYAKQLGGVEGVDYVQGDSFTSTDENGVTHTYYTAKLIGDPIDKTIELIDRGVANNAKQNVFSAWSYAKDLGMTNEKWENMSREEKEALILKMLQHEGGDITKMAYYNQDLVSSLNSQYGGEEGWNNSGYFDDLKTEYEAYLTGGKTALTDKQWERLQDNYGIDERKFRQMAQNYAKTGMKDKYVGAVSSSLEAAVELYEYINGNKAKFEGKDIRNWSSLVNDMFRGGNVQAGLLSKLFSYIPTTKQYDAKSYFDALNNRETLQKLIETKSQGATYGAMSEGEWKLLASASNLLDRNQSGEQFQKNLENLIYALSTAVQEGGGTLPTNYYKSTASNMIMQGENAGRWNSYKQDNTPFYADVDYSSYSTSGPSEI